jgi:uncharacterized protein (TIGR04255 family)
LTRAEILSLKQAMHPTLPLYATERASDLSVEITPTGLRQVGGGEQELVKFLSRSRRTSVTFSPTNTVIETTDYRGWTDFKRFVMAGLAARQDIAPMDGVIRVGIRVIDEIRVPPELRGNWSEWLAQSLLPPEVTSEGVTLALKQQQAVVQYAGHGPGETVTVRYGAMDGPAAITSAPNLIRRDVPEPGPYFLIDTDAAWELTAGDDMPVLNPGELGELADRLHAPMKEIFESFITDRLRREVFE